MVRLLILTLMLGCFCCSVSAQVLHKKASGKKVYSYNGNLFKFSEPMSFMVGGSVKKSVPAPIEVNGEKIYRSGYNIDNEPQLTENESFTAYISEKMKPIFEKLPDGRYIMPTFNLIINTEGKLIFYDFREITDMSGNLKKISGEGSETYMMMVMNQIPAPQKKETRQEISSSLRKELNKAMEEALVNTPMFTPAMATGKKVNCVLFPNYDFNDFIVVKDHKVSFEEGLRFSTHSGRKSGAR